MKYKGIELKEVTEPQIFDPPKKMLVWDNSSNVIELRVYAIVSHKDFPVICENSTWRHCAEIPKVPELELVTYRELARWLAKGKGQYRKILTTASTFTYANEEENNSVEEWLYVRKWDDTEWHKPTREYLGLED